MIDGQRIAQAGEGLDAHNRLMARMVAAFDEHLAEALSCRSPTEAIERIREFGLTRTADQLQAARARGQMISIRTREGLAVARAEGRKGGRRPKLTPEQVEFARGLIDRKEATLAGVARDLGVSRGTLYRALGVEPEALSA